MNTIDRVTRFCSRLAIPAAGIAVGVVLSTTGVNAAPPSPPVPQTVAAAPSATGSSIEIAKHRFSLPTVTVPAGTTVTWVNHDDDAHTVVSTIAMFRSPGLDTDDTFSYRFTKPGTYQYFCTLHPLMIGTVIVR